MIEHNSLVEFYSSLARCLHADAADKFGASTSEVARDHEEIRNRCGSEGIAFLTKTLPELAKQLDSVMGQGSTFAPEGFARIPGTSLPIFMGWAWTKLLASDGSLLPLPDKEDERRRFAELVRCVRQFLYAMYKLELPYEAKDTQKVLDDFVSVDSGLQKPDLDNVLIKHWLNKARAIISRVFVNFDHLDIIPKHGPGAVATGERLGGKYYFRRLYRAIERVYPYTEYFHYSLSHVADRYQRYESLEEMEAGTAKVVLVPKDSRGPRLISAEPLEYQWIQQGLGNKIREHLESHRDTRGRVNFTHQEYNQYQALIGSGRWSSWATLDMKEASDRVSLDLVKTLFSGTRLLEALLATRSVATRLPDGRLVTLKKFAPMGSNLCFPVEALVFWALAVSALVVYMGIPLRKARDRVYVYGDDIVCRLEDCETIMTVLPWVGLAFNPKKCNYKGPFRESCGVEAFDGFNITPVRFRTVFRQDRVNVGAIASYTAYSNALWLRGDYRSASFCEMAVQRVLLENKRHPMPYYFTEPVRVTPPDQTTREWNTSSPLERAIRAVETSASWAPQQRLPLAQNLGFYREIPTAQYENEWWRVKRRVNRKIWRGQALGYRIQPARRRVSVEGWEELLGRTLCKVQPASWNHEDVVRAQLAEAAEKLGSGWFLDPRALALVRAWGTY